MVLLEWIIGLISFSFSLSVSINRRINYTRLEPRKWLANVNVCMLVDWSWKFMMVGTSAFEIWNQEVNNRHYNTTFIFHVCLLCFFCYFFFLDSSCFSRFHQFTLPLIKWIEIPLFLWGKNVLWCSKQWVAWKLYVQSHYKHSIEKEASSFIGVLL